MGVLTNVLEGSASASAIDISDALTTVSSVFTSAMSIITGNAVLMVFFASGLLGIGFRLVKKARRSVA